MGSPRTAPFVCVCVCVCVRPYMFVSLYHASVSLDSRLVAIFDKEGAPQELRDGLIDPDFAISTMRGFAALARNKDSVNASIIEASGKNLYIG